MEWPRNSKTESKAPSGRFFYFIKKNSHITHRMVTTCYGINKRQQRFRTTTDVVNENLKIFINLR